MCLPLQTVQKVNANEICMQLQVFDRFSKRNGLNRISWAIKILFFRIFYDTHILYIFPTTWKSDQRLSNKASPLFFGLCWTDTLTHTICAAHIYTNQARLNRNISISNWILLKIMTLNEWATHKSPPSTTNKIQRKRTKNTHTLIWQTGCYTARCRPK